MGTGIGKPEELAMAGILHDVGLADIPQEIQLKNEADLNAAEMRIYQTHVDLSLKIIRDRKLIVPELVLKVIQQHHERMDGSGYPGAIDGKRFLPSAQILALANEFDKLTVVIDGKPRLTPVQAIQKIKDDCFKNPALPKFDPEIIKKLVALFSGSAPA
jgi:HD-GYP domain-containing protein (c-di-GMP phosphodiesterase class II)